MKLNCEKCDFIKKDKFSLFRHTEPPSQLGNYMCAPEKILDAVPLQTWHWAVWCSESCTYSFDCFLKKKETNACTKRENTNNCHV